MYVQSREHLPPHIHAFSGDDEALIDIRTGKIHDGYLAPKKLKIVQQWLAEGANRERVEENIYELNPRLRPQRENSMPKQIVKTKSKKKAAQ